MTCFDSDRSTPLPPVDAPSNARLACDSPSTRPRLSLTLASSSLLCDKEITGINTCTSRASLRPVAERRRHPYISTPGPTPGYHRVLWARAGSSVRVPVPVPLPLPLTGAHGRPGRHSRRDGGARPRSQRRPWRSAEPRNADGADLCEMGHLGPGRVWVGGGRAGLARWGREGDRVEGSGWCFSVGRGHPKKGIRMDWRDIR